MRQSTKSNWENFWKSKASVHEVYSNADRILRNLIAVTDLKGKHVLEVGAGTGRDSLRLVKLGAVVFQIDYAESSLAIIRSISKEEGISVHAVQGDAFALPFGDHSFDIVFHQGLLEHFGENDARKLLRENIRVVKPGGLLLVDVPQRYHIYTIFKHILILIGRWFAGWEREFSVRELKWVVEGEGVQVIHTYGEWMYPSLFYRAIREALRKMNVYLPLQPRLFRPLSNLRASIRSRLWHTSLALYTSISIGVIARKGRT